MLQNHSSVWRLSRGEYTPTDCQCSEQGAADIRATQEGEEVCHEAESPRDIPQEQFKAKT